MTPESATNHRSTKDSGTLQYEIFNEDESEAVVFERYRDAAIEHSASGISNSTECGDFFD
jgi:quinol monooxygenase YgiN